MKKNAIEIAIESLKLAKVELERQLEDVVNAIRSLGGDESYLEEPNIKKQVVDPGYDRNWSHSEKFVYFLKRENRFLHIREVAELLISLEGGELKDVVDKITSGTGSLRKNGSIVKIQPSNMFRDTFWGSPKWLNESGEVIAGHEFNPDYLYNSAKSKELLEI